MKREKGKYKWLILVAVFLGQSLTFGLSYSVGVLYKDWTNYFDSPASFLSVIGSAPTAISCLLGPVFGYLLNKLNHRICGLIGGLIMAIGLSASSLVQNASQLLFTYGILTGFGLGLSYFAQMALVNEYFIENRQLAEGVIGGGVGFGNFIFALFQQFLLNHFTWKGSMLICGALCLHLCLNAMFLIPSQSISSHPLNFWKNSEKAKRHEVSVSSVSNPTNILSDVEVETESGGKRNPASKKYESFFNRTARIWKNPLFLMFALAELLSWLGNFIPYVHLVERGIRAGLDENTASWLSSTSGLAAIAGRPFCGIISNYFHFDPLWSYLVIRVVLGVATVASSFWSSTTGLFTYAVILGFLSGGGGFMRASAAKLLGLEFFAIAFSWMLVFQGTGIVVGPFLAGYIYDVTQSYTWSFRFSGMLLISSGLVCLLKSPAERCLSRRNNATSEGKENVAYKSC